MTLSEFKAWFEGFTENMDGVPSEKQFKKIKAKVAEIDGEPITREIYIHRYPHYGWWTYPVTSFGSGSIGVGLGTYSVGGNAISSNANDFNSHSAMYAAGTMEARAS